MFSVATGRIGLSQVFVASPDHGPAGTNNVFPQIREATIAGIAAGLVATGGVSSLKPPIETRSCMSALTGALYLGCGGCVDLHAAMGWIEGDLASRHFESDLRHLCGSPTPSGSRLWPDFSAGTTRRTVWVASRSGAAGESSHDPLKAPIAPGLVVPLGVACVCEIPPNSPRK
ncbi:MAG: hypothetical protein U0V70_00500 [Terriglobia bacterium]